MTRRTHNLFSPITHAGNDLDRFISGVFDRNLARQCSGGSQATWLPAMDISEVDDIYKIEAELPGFKLDDIEVTIEGRKLVIAGTKQTVETSDSDDPDALTSETNYHVRERRSGSFSRVVTLPVNVDPAQADAEMHDGVLTLSVPKAEAARQHKIDIRSR